MSENNIATKIRTRIRALIEDLLKNESETFTYESGDKVFTLQEENINAISSVTKNGVALGSGDYSFDSDTNELTISVALSANDIVIVKYSYYKYSNTEIEEYIRASLVWLSIFDVSENDFELEDDDIYPEPDGRTSDLIALVASILIKPDWTEYRLPNVTLRYSGRIPKEDRIERLINRYTLGIGVNDVIEFD